MQFQPSFMQNDENVNEIAFFGDFQGSFGTARAEKCGVSKLFKLKAHAL